MRDTFCCDKFREQATDVQDMVGGGFLYPKEAQPDAQFTLSEDGKSWLIQGCCGGGCCVVTEMLFCPYCGSKLIE